MTRASLADATLMFALLARPGDVFELRGLSKVNGQPQVHSGYFDDVGELVRAAAQRSGQDHGVYVTINPVNPALLARAEKNRVRRAGSGDTTGDRDVQRRRTLLVDVDPIRPTGISSTDAEHEDAIALVQRIALDLGALGWPDPIVGDSGNGGHLLYGIDLPVDDAGLVKRVLEQLSKRYTTPAIKVDEKVFNPARISKIYGTLTRKGADTPERPHRLARILSAPTTLEVVTREQLEAFAPIAAPLKREREHRDYQGGQRPPFELEAWLAEHLPDAKEAPWSEGRKWLLPVCPFNDSHDRKEAHVEQFPSGAVSAGCLHESCKWTWRELRQRFEPDAYDRAPANNGQRLSDREPPPEVIYEDRDYAAEHAVTMTRPATEPPKPAFRMLTVWEALAELERLAGAVIYPTPFSHVNDAIGFGGFLGTQVYTVAAGTGRGKTTWVAGVAAHVAELGIPVIVASYEMKPGYFVARHAAGQLGVHSNVIIRGEIESGSVAASITPAIATHLVLMHRPSLKELEACVEHLKERFEVPPLVIVDYLQKLADEIMRTQQRPDMRLATTEASATLLDIADRTCCAILAVSAIGRGKGRALANPRKYNPYELVEVAKESGAVEYDGAGMIVLTLSDDMDGNDRIATMTVAKARFGYECHVDARFDGAHGRWSSCGRVAKVDKLEAEPDTKPTVDQLGVRLINDLRSRGPAKTKTELIARTKGNKQQLGEAYEALLGTVIVKVAGVGITLASTVRQVEIDIPDPPDEEPS
jgi:hypothetical protein